MVSILKYPYDGTYLKGATAVNQIIKMRLETPLNDILYERNRGCKIDEILFEPNDTILGALASKYIQDALRDIAYIKINDVETLSSVEVLEIIIWWRFNDAVQQKTQINFPRF